MFLSSLLKITFFLILISPVIPQEPREEISNDSRNESIFKTKLKGKNIIELIRSENTDYINFQEGDDGVFIFNGGIILQLGESTLRAETIKFNPQTGDIYGEGKVTLREGNRVISGDQFIYGNQTKHGVVYKAKTNTETVYFLGESIEKTPKDVYITNLAFFSSCNIKNPHYFFKAKRVWIYPDNRFVALHVFYYVGQTPVFYWPIIFQTKSGTGILTFYGNNQEKGHFLQNTYYFNIPEWTPYSSFLPQDGKLIFDFYQHTGQNFGIFTQNRSKYTSYDIDVGLANYNIQNRICEVDPENQSCNQIITTLIRQPDGSFDQDNRFWWKVNSNLMAHWGKDVQSHFSLQIDHYNQRNYEPEFGYRIEPANTLEIISFSPIFVDAGPERLLWKAQYSLDWENFHFDIQVERNFRWNQASTVEDSKYLPELDVLPKIHFTQRWQLLKQFNKFYSGSWIDLAGSGDIISTFNNESKRDKTIYRGDMSLTSIHQFYFTRWIGFDPSLAYGMQYRTTTPVTDDLELESMRLSYYFMRIKSPLKVGLHWIYLLTEYEYNLFFLRRFNDPTFNNQGPHFLNFFFKIDYNNWMLFHSKTRRELRRYPYTLPEHFRWHPLNLFSEIKYDFLNKNDLLSTNTKKDAKYFYISMGDEHNYLIRYQRNKDNEVFLGLTLGNADIASWSRLNQIYARVGWYHNFIHIRQDYITFRFGFDLSFYRDWRIIFEMNSRADQLERYQEDVSFFEDIINSIDSSRDDQSQGSIFNLNFLRAVLEHRLHKWILRITYERRIKSSFWGTNLQNNATFYEQSIYISMQLSDFTIFGIPETRVYRQDSADNLY